MGHYFITYLLVINDDSTYCRTEEVILKVIKRRKMRWVGRVACRIEEGIVGEYFELGKYGICRFVMYNIVGNILFKGCL
jgi:hypothetical protein